LSLFGGGIKKNWKTFFYLSGIFYICVTNQLKKKMETLKFKAIITGPEAYLPEGVKVEDFEITEQDVLEVIEEGETSEDAIAYIKEEYCATWEQHWCKVTLLTEEEFDDLMKPAGPVPPPKVS
jgi:hypothetical protein